MGVSNVQDQNGQLTEAKESSPKRLKVAVLTRHFTPQSGGAERYAMALVECMKNDHEVHVFAQRIQHAPEGVHYHRISEPFKRPRWLNQWWYAWQTWRQSRVGFDVIHSHENTWHGQVQSVHVVPSTVSFFSSLERSNGLIALIKMIAKLLSLILSPRMMTYWWFERQRLHRRSGKCVVSVSKTLEAQLQHHYALDAQHLMTISPGVQSADVWLKNEGLDHLGPHEVKGYARAKLGLDASKTWLLWVGNDARKKGLQTTIEALAQLPKNVHLMVVGQARHASSLMKAFSDEPESSKVSSRIEFLGALADVSMAYAASDILVHPTLEDTFGMVVLEAMSFGRPVCLSQASFCGIAAHLQHKVQAYLLDDPRDANQLLQGLNWILQNDNGARLSAAGWEWSKTQNWQDKAREMEEVYLQSIKNRYFQASTQP